MYERVRLSKPLPIALADPPAMGVRYAPVVCHARPQRNHIGSTRSWHLTTVPRYPRDSSHQIARLAIVNRTRKAPARSINLPALYCRTNVGVTPKKISSICCLCLLMTSSFSWGPPIGDIFFIFFWRIRV
jgi:hypothetical protein